MSNRRPVTVVLGLLAAFGLLCTAPSVAADEPARAPDSAPASAPAASETSRVAMPTEQVIGRVEEPLPRIVLLEMGQRFATEARPDVERHAVAELRAAGIDVVRKAARAKDAMVRVAELGAVAARERAIGAMRIVKRGNHKRVQIWIYDTVTEKMVLREAETTANGVAASLDLGHQVVEVLTASLLEIRMRHRSQRPTMVRAPEVAEQLVSSRMKPARRYGRFQLALGPTVILSPGELGAAIGLTVNAGVALLPWLIVGVEGSLPLTRFEAHRDTRQAELMTFAVRAMTQAAPWTFDGWTPSVGIGIGALFLHGSGQEDAGSSDWANAAIVSLRLKLSRRLTGWMQVWAAFWTSVALPETRLRFAVDSEASSGVLWLEGGLGLSWCAGDTR